MRRIILLLVGILLSTMMTLAQQPSAPTLPPGATPNAPASDVTPAAVTLSEAQATTLVPGRTCPVQVQSAVTATDLICDGLQDGQVCLGNGIVEAAPRPDAVDVNLGQPADRTALVNLQSLRLRTLDTENALYTVVTARPQLLTTSGQIVSALMVLFGDATLTDDGDVIQEVSGQRTGSVIADFGLNIRRAPDPASQTVWQLQSGDTVVVTGRLADRTWLRVIIPNGFGSTGWVYAPYIDVSGDVETVGIVDASSPVPAPIVQQTIEFETMQAFMLSTGITDASCADTPDSGLLLQSPDGVTARVRTRINDVEIEFNGTLLLQAQADGTFQAYILEGEARFIADDFPSETVPGQVVTLSLNSNLEASSAPVPDAADPASLNNLPLTLLARPIALAGDIPQPTAISETPAAEATTNVEVTPAISQVGLPTPVVPADVAPTLAPAVGSLTSAATGELCGAATATLTETANPQGTTTEVGGIWRVTAGTTVTFEVTGGTFQPGFANYIRLNAITGIAAQSGAQPILNFTFTTDSAFTASFSSQAGDTLTVTVRCG